MATNVSESTIQRGILDYLNLVVKDCYAFRSAAGSIRLPGGRYFKTGRPGCPDITCIFKGRAVFFEVKTATGRQSVEQKQAEKDIKKAGGEYYVVRSIADVKAIVQPA